MKKLLNFCRSFNDILNQAVQKMDTDADVSTVA